MKVQSWAEVDRILRQTALRHMERLVAGRERIYLDRFWNEFAANQKKFSEGSRRQYA
jgi:hypothetical protein